MPTRLTQRRYLLAGVAILLISVLAVWAVTTCSIRNRGAAQASWQPLTGAELSSMREQPLPGWRLTVVDLGLPPTGNGRIAVSNDPRGPRPFIGSVGSSAYFLANSGASDTPQWWLAGIDVRDGRRLFDAIPLSVATRSPKCFLNGPSDVLCLDQPRTFAWVIDGRSGTVKYGGPTDLRLGSGTLAVEQIGMYAVAATEGRGVFGVGPRAETTWFVPGNGLLQIRQGATPQTLTAQHDTNPRRRAATVFSVVDGGVVEPDVDEGATLINTQFYSGGFAAEVAKDDGSRSGIDFFDESGARVGDREVEGVLKEGPVDLPVISRNGHSVVYSPQGRQLIEVPKGALKLVGAALMVNGTTSQAFPEWQQYSLRDGTKGPICDFPMQNYLGTDGATLVFEVTNRNADALATARDLDSCAELWSIPKQPGSTDRIWRIDGTLVQLHTAGTELTSLRTAA